MVALALAELGVQVPLQMPTAIEPGLVTLIVPLLVNVTPLTPEPTATPVAPMTVIRPLLTSFVLLPVIETPMVPVELIVPPNWIEPVPELDDSVPAMLVPMTGQ